MNEYLGPLINHIEKSITRRDSLGIEGVANTISAQLCPIVNIVTPRPFYWAFITWGYWKQYQLTNKEDDIAARKLIRRVNYYFALGNYLTHNVLSNDNFIGLSTIPADAQYQNVFEYNSRYIVNGNGDEDYLSTMAYYPPGVEYLHLAVTRDNDGQEYKQHHLTPKGEKVALAFEKVMQQTEYGRNHVEDEEVSKSVLMELGSIVDIRMTKFDECKKLLIQYLFDEAMPSYDSLPKSKDYIKYTIKKFNLNEINLTVCRDRFFDAYSPRGENNEIPEELRDQAKGWEIAISRQYFTTGLSIIWTHVQSMLTRPLSKQQWIAECLQSGMDVIKANDKLETVLPSFTLNSNQIETVARSARPNSCIKRLECGLIILLAIYNRLKDRNDFNEEQQYFMGIGEGANISLNEFIKTVDVFKERSVKEFLAFVMDDYLIEQHLKTAFSKMVQGRDGYFIEEMEGFYTVKEPFSWDFQGNRMVQLFSVMKDLEVLA